jgi:hypothetical protein
MQSTQEKKQIGFKLLAIELLDFSLNFQEKAIIPFKTYHFNLRVEQRIIEDKKMVIVTLHVAVLHEDQETILATVRASCIFEIFNFEALERNVDGNISLPEQTNISLNSITISTMRGIMFSLFRGTYLHNAFLPIVDPTSLKIDK